MKILRPLARILLKNGVSYGVFTDLAKKAFVSVATEDYGTRGRNASVSKVAILTGLSRKAVKQLRDEVDSGEEPIDRGYNRAARVVSGWIRDRRFLDDRKEPLELKVDPEGDEPSFRELVRVHGGDIPPGALLKELKRVGNVEFLPDGSVRLLTRAYVPRKDAEEKMQFLGIDAVDLISTIDHNLMPGRKPPFFQRVADYDNLPEEALPELRSLVSRHAQEWLEFLSEHISTHDRDLNPEVSGTGRFRAGAGIYYFEEEIDEPAR
jgi:hypothetical protein